MVVEELDKELESDRRKSEGIAGEEAAVSPKPKARAANANGRNMMRVSMMERGDQAGCLG